MLDRKNKQVRRKRIKYVIRKRLSGTSERPRLAVYRSNKYISAQVIDDQAQKTLLSISSRQLEGSGLTVIRSHQVGEQLAKLAIEKGIATVVFDRSGYPYHGRVKALAEGARKGGLKF